MAGSAVFDRDIHNAASQTQQVDKSIVVMMTAEMDNKLLMVS